MDLTFNQANELFFEGEIVLPDGTRLETIHEGEFSQDHKMQTAELIFKNHSDGLTYRTYITREGSPFTDWHYEDGDGDLGAERVELRKITVERWVTV